MRDILEAIAYEARVLGVDAEVIDDEFSKDDDVVHLVIPHEFFAVTPRKSWPTQDQLSRTVALTVEHPGTPWFEISAKQARRCAAVVDINRDSTDELNRRGLSAEHFQIGYTPAWDAWNGNDGERAVDILYLGSTDERRDRAISAYASLWWPYSTRVLIPGQEPKTSDSPHYYLGKRKFDLLADSRVSMNLHRLQTTSLEWVRVIEAMSNGCVVVSEHSTDSSPLIAGEHYISGSYDNLGLYAARLIDDQDRARRISRCGYDFIREHLPMASSVQRVLEVGESLLQKPQRVPTLHEIEPPPNYTPPEPGWPRHPSQLDFIGSGLRRMEHRLRRLELAVARTEHGLDINDDGVVDDYCTPAYDAVTPRCSVIIPLHNYEKEILDALNSLAAVRDIDFEVLIQDDESTDSSADVARRYLQEHPWLPGKLRRARLNRGLSATRNDLVAEARAEYIFTLDADNGVFPPALRKLADALDDDPEAAFAYSVIASRSNGRPHGLVSARPWQPELFRQNNYIDAMAMLRKSTLTEHGGYDTSMFGWEDFHLWVRIAESGGYGAFVPQPLTWYRVNHHSMTSETHIDYVALWSKIRSAAPKLMRDDRA